MLPKWVSIFGSTKKKVSRNQTTTRLTKLKITLSLISSPTGLILYWSHLFCFIDNSGCNRFVFFTSMKLRLLGLFSQRRGLRKLVLSFCTFRNKTGRFRVWIRTEPLCWFTFFASNPNIGSFPSLVKKFVRWKNRRKNQIAKWKMVRQSIWTLFDRNKVNWFSTL